MKTLKYYILIKLVQLLNRKWSKVPSAVVLAQAVHETQNFTSNIYNENKNLFGMKEASVREKTSIGTNRGHAKYSSYYNSIKDYFLRQEDFNLINYTNEDEYMHATIASKYATDPNYLGKWNNILTQIKGSIKKANYLWIVLLIVVPCSFLLLLYWLYNKYIKKGGKTKWKRS